MKANAKTEDPHADVGKLDKDGDKAMNDQNERRLRMHSAFVSERQILDGHFIINELLHWCKRKHEKAMFFKVDFAKAYDSVRWVYLIDVLGAFGFGSKWCQWIRGDALIIGEWSNENLRGIINILKCFFLAPGLQINIHKSQLLGVGVSRSATEAAASSIGCSIMDKQFCYLGIMVGGNTSRHKAWEEVVLKIRSRLPKWKAKTLSIGGESNLHDTFPRMFALETDKQSTVAAKIAQVDGSFRRLVWGGLEQDQFNKLISFIDSVSLSSSQDKWVCNASGDGSFRVKDIRNLIDDLILPSWFEHTRWVKFIPIKINIFVWRARRDCLPTRSNLVQRGVFMDSNACSICGAYEEDIHRILFQCDLAQAVLRRICRW
nr:RNA-directed DNA polymerase, eukaryota [Tanacetum cinerariifolium]